MSESKDSPVKNPKKTDQEDHAKGPRKGSDNRKQDGK